MFANEAEILSLPRGGAGGSGRGYAPKVATLVVTRSELGALAVSGGETAEVPAEPIERWSTPPGGDLFAPGFLQEKPAAWLGRSLKLGAIAAAEVSSLWRAARARPESAGGRPA